MILKKYVFSLFLIICLSCVSTALVYACSCGDKPTVLSAFESSKDVFIAKVITLEKGDENLYEKGIKGVRIKVQKTYKGSFKENEEIFIDQGHDGICGIAFNEKYIGEEFLIYDLHKDFDILHISYCGRSEYLKSAEDDLLYLDNLEKVKGKSRISGTLHYWGIGENKPSDENQIIKITNFKTKKTYKVKTNKDGVYEIYGLPAGWYYVETEPAKGWKSDNLYRRYLPVDYQAYEKLNEKDYPENPQNKQGWTKPDAFYLFPNRHAGLDFNFVEN